MPLMLHTPATALAVSPSEAKLHLRVDASEEDTLIAALISSATLDAEHIMGRAVMPQKWVLTLDEFEDSISLSRPRVTAIDSIKYVDSSTGSLTTIDPSDYQLAAASEYGARVVPAFGKCWPSARAQPEAVQIIFTAGYVDAASVPETVKSWVLLRVGALYANREAWTLGQKIERNEFVDGLLDRYRVWGN